MNPTEQITQFRARQKEIEEQQRLLNVEYRANKNIIKELEKWMQEIKDNETPKQQ